MMSVNSPSPDNIQSKAFGKKLKRIGGIAVLSLAGLGGLRTLQCLSFVDAPGASKLEFGRTVNSLSSLIGGIVAQRISPNSHFTMTIEKPLFADAEITGTTTPESIHSRVELALTSAEFNAIRTSDGFSGTVNKSEFDWSIRQCDEHTWEIGRFGLKLDTKLVCKVSDGVISGTYSRPLAFDWSISGRYTPEGVVSIHVGTGPLDPSFRISGKVK